MNDAGPIERPGVTIRPNVGWTSRPRQRADLVHHAIANDVPAVSLIVRGTKRLSGSGVRVTARAGELVVIPAGPRIDINNIPDAQGGYEAVFVAFTTDDAHVPDPNARQLTAPRVLSNIEPAFARAVLAAREAIVDHDGVPETIARHRVAELVLWIERAGSIVRAQARPTAAATIRSLVARDPSRAWTSAELARELAMSEATMRRRLAGEDTTMTRVVGDARLSLALTLLQTTDDPISQIAPAVGYGDQSAFARGFRERFGHPPSAIRAEAQELERIGTKFDRTSRARFPTPV